MSAPRALDLFCGAGGVTKGLQRAGFHVTGVDIKRQPRYCGDTFVQADALRPPFRLSDFDLIWASPPCQAFSISNSLWRRKYPNLIDATRDLLAGHPVTVIENVPGAPIRPDIVLNGLMFGLPLVRRRHFETSFRPPLALLREAAGTVTNGDLACVAGHGVNRGRWAGRWLDLSPDVRARLSARNSKAGWAEAMGIDWMTRDEMAQAIPPAYSEYIGRWALRFLRAGAAA